MQIYPRCVVHLREEMYVQASFDMAVADAIAAPAISGASDQLAQFSKDAAGAIADTKPKLTRDQAYSKELSTKWQGNK